MIDTAYQMQILEDACFASTYLTAIRTVAEQGNLHERYLEEKIRGLERFVARCRYILEQEERND